MRSIKFRLEVSKLLPRLAPINIRRVTNDFILGIKMNQSQGYKLIMRSFRLKRVKIKLYEIKLSY